jgi:NAD(P)-dependent dehydrogenase (short-subunit alcohol dehydrogenase family)
MEGAMTQDKVWLVTGSGSGLGRDIVEAALAEGHSVVATARDAHQLDDLVARYGQTVRAVPLDVTDEEQGKAAVQTALDEFGRLDVLVNNAGYGDSRPFEEMPSGDFRKLIETVLFGTVNLTRAALPVMRKQRSGLIIQISSAGGRFASAGQAAYHAAKWAVGGFTDAVAQETAVFGVRLITLEPGALRTNWGKRAYDNRPSIGPDYQATVGAAQERLASLWGNEPIDPQKVAKLVVRLPQEKELPARLLLGASTLDMIETAEAERAKQLERWRLVSKAVDFDAEVSIDEVTPRD